MTQFKPGKSYQTRAKHKTTPAPHTATVADSIQAETLFSWEASEYQAHQRSSSWYFLFLLASAILVGLSFWLLGLMSAIVIVLMSVAVMIYAQRAPEQLHYSLNDVGIYIGSKLYPYSDFNAFAVVPDRDWFTIELDPVKRFMPRLEIFFDKDEIEKILDILELRLPRSDRDPDLIERLTRYLKF